MGGYILLITASVLKWILTPLAYTYGVIRSLANKDFNRYNKHLAIAKDQYGNGLCQYLFNDLLITKDGYKFGNIDETISSVVGKNKRDNTLSFLGRVLDSILNKIDKNHSIKSIDVTENN